MGYRSEIFAEHVAAELEAQIRHLDELDPRSDDILIVHHSMGYDAFERVLALPQRKILRYQNITPPEWLTDPGLRSYSRLGRRQVRRLIAHAGSIAANSNFSRRDLLSLGATRVHVLPEVLDLGRFRRAGERDRKPSRDWLFVGRLIENKCQHDLIAAFGVFSSAFDPAARLHLVGDVSVVAYVERLRHQVREAGLEDRVVFWGKLSDEDLLERFVDAGIYVSLSEHEGFGVPLLEAMAAGLPVVAFGDTAVTETMGGAGVLIHDKSPGAVSATVYELLTTPALLLEVTEGERRRIERLETQDVDGLLVRCIDEALGVSEPLEVQVQGPFETTYSLAVLNRRLAEELDQLPGLRVSIHATEGPGDYEPRAEDLAHHPVAAELWRRGFSVPFPDVVIRQMFPPRVDDSPGGLTLQYFGWEESLLPPGIAESFETHVDRIGAMSHFVERLLRDSGVTVPVDVTGVGVDALELEAPDLPELRSLRRLRFLHVSSAFPRKGIDVLLSAFFDAFSGADDVSLILKTHPNPHNEVEDLLEGARSAHRDPPDVRWIDRDLGPSELEGLYAVADWYVHPARGEGFGLPVAEAMLAGVPVISTATTGLSELCSDKTALVVPAVEAPARTHVSVPGSMWTEPDGSALRDHLRAVYDSPDEEAIASRVEAARQLVATRFSWPAVAGRWRQLIDRAREAAHIPHVAWVSPWNSRCGIAEYSRYLVEAVERHSVVEIFADLSGEVVDWSAEEGVVRAWQDRTNGDLSALERALLESEADVVHVQFNFGFFELEQLAGLFDTLLADHRAVVVTLHATHEPKVGDRAISLGQIARTLARVDRVLVHQQADAERLEGYGIAGNVEVVPHGALVGGLPPRNDVRGALRLGDRPIIGTFGFVLPHKGTKELITAMAEVHEQHPDALLLAVSALHPDPSSQQYLDECRREIERLGLAGSVVMVTEFLPELEARTLLSAADLIVLPYKDSPEGASGALRFVIGLGRPVLTTSIPIFADAADVTVQVPEPSPGALAKGVLDLLGDEERRAAVARRCASFADEVSWRAIADRHLEIYRESMIRARGGAQTTRTGDPESRSTCA
jgi:glycosyltransferase involved in cell wall biosynthesis